MTGSLTERLNQVLPRVTSDSFLSGAGLGNEIAFYIFAYPPEDELDVRRHITFLLEQIPRHRPGLRVKHVDLFDFAIGHLRDRNLLHKTIRMQREKDPKHVIAQLEKVLDPEKTKNVFADVAAPDKHDLVFVSGVGNVFPMMRAHKLLNNIHSVMGSTPLVLFYPGRYDGQHLALFGKLRSDNYYRAFKLVP
jgi:bacteriophage exclusion system BrxB-like protein